MYQNCWLFFVGFFLFFGTVHSKLLYWQRLWSEYRRIVFLSNFEEIRFFAQKVSPQNNDQWRFLIFVVSCGPCEVSKPKKRFENANT